MKRKYTGAFLVMAVLIAAVWILGTVLDRNTYVDFPEIYPESALETAEDDEIARKVDALLASMTEEEMYSMLGGSSSAASERGCGTGYVGGVPRLGVPVLRMWDGPKGVTGSGKYATTSPASELAYDYGKLTGSEDKMTAANCQLGAQLDLVRAPFFRRSRDSMGEDAYLTSKLGYQLSKGIQDQNVMTTLKHLACYSETASGRNANVQVDEQTLHEMYLAPYEYIIKNRGASAVMTSYNGVNGYNTCSNTYLLKTVLRDMWGFSGLVMTDWGGNYEFTTDKGVDLETGTLNRNNKDNIEAAIAAGTMTWDDAVNAVRHTLTAMGEVGYLGLVEVKQNGTAAEDPNPPATIELGILEGEERNAVLEENDKVALESAVRGSVLLKNDNEALPVSGTDSIAMIGLLADHSLSHISESSWGWLQKMTGAYTEIKELLGENANITEAVGLDTIGEPVSAEYLYTTEDCTVNGVNVSITTGENTEDKVISNIRLTTGTIDGKTNRTYKNSADGNALMNGQTAVMTAYLKAPETGIYEFEVQKIGGEARVNIITEETDENGTVTEKENSINGSGTTGGGRGSTGASSWPSTGVVPTAEGMDVPTSTTKLNLEAGKVYKITVTAAGKLEKDLEVGEDESTRYTAPGNIKNDTTDPAEKAYIDYLYQVMDEDAVEQVQKDGETVVNPEGILYMTANSSSGSKYYDLVLRMQTYIAARWQEDVPTYSVIHITDETFTINTYRTDNDEKIDETFTIVKTEKTQDTKPETKTDISTAEAAAVKNQVYTGKAITPEVKLNCQGRQLVQGTDYTVAYTNNKNTGLAAATITGMGAYTGIKTVNFKIVPKKAALKSVKAVGK